MLSGYQREVIAFLTDGGGILHYACAVERHDTVTVEKAERGLTTGADLSPLIRYEAESAFEPDGVTCDHCGEWIVEPTAATEIPAEAAALAELLLEQDGDLYRALRDVQDAEDGRVVGDYFADYALRDLREYALDLVRMLRLIAEANPGVFALPQL